MRLAGLIAVSFALLVTGAAAGIGLAADVSGAVSIAGQRHDRPRAATTLSKRVRKVVARAALSGDWGVPW